MTSRARETLLLTLPSDSSLARLARRVALHFFRQNGLPAGLSRAAAAKVERGWRRLAAGGVRRGRGGSAPRMSLRFVAGARSLEVFGHLPRSAQRLLARCERPATS